MRTPAGAAATTDKQAPPRRPHDSLPRSITQLLSGQQLATRGLALPANKNYSSCFRPTRELGPQLPELLAPAGLSVESFFYKGKDWITSFLDAIPALAVRTSLVMQTNKNGSRAWTRSDIYDIDALEAAVPYCDVVVTEKYACRAINKSRLADRFAAKVIRRLQDLIPILQSIA